MAASTNIPARDGSRDNLIAATLGKSAIMAATVADTGTNLFDPGFGKTAQCRSAITFIDGEKGVLLYRGYPAEQVAESLSFLETALLLVNGELPGSEETALLTDAVLRTGPAAYAKVSPLVGACPDGLPPMAIVSSAVSALSALGGTGLPDEVAGIPRYGVQLLAVAPYLVANAFAAWRGRGTAPERPDLGYVPNFLHLCFGSPDGTGAIDPVFARALEMLLILHADHELNCSTSTLRVVGSANSGFFAAASAAVSALWGPLHGGANQAVVQMLERIHADGDNLDKYVAKAKDRTDPFRLMGFGHRVYKTTDARAKVIRELTIDVVGRFAADDPLLGLALRLEEIALTDDYFISRHLYPNVDFYSGLLYRTMGFPVEIFTPLFFLGRVPGWVAHWKESLADPDRRISRPAQVYVGPLQRDVPFGPEPPGAMIKLHHLYSHYASSRAAGGPHVDDLVRGSCQAWGQAEHCLRVREPRPHQADDARQAHHAAARRCREARRAGPQGERRGGQAEAARDRRQRHRR